MNPRAKLTTMVPMTPSGNLKNKQAFAGELLVWRLDHIVRETGRP